jgi:uncharacterized membrane protein
MMETKMDAQMAAKSGRFTKLYPHGSGSAVSIMGHPLHPMVVPLPIACLIGVFVCDLAFLSTQDSFWSRASFTLLGAGLAAGGLAAVLGALEAASVQRARSSSLMWAHAFANVLAIIASAANFKLRWEAEDLWVAAGPYLSTLVAFLLLVSGWLGGSLAYKHGIGVSRRVGGQPEEGDLDRTADGSLDISREPRLSR